MSADEMSLRQKFEFIRRDYDEWPGELIAQALNEIDRLRRVEARARHTATIGNGFSAVERAIARHILRAGERP